MQKTNPVFAVCLALVGLLLLTACAAKPTAPPAKPEVLNAQSVNAAQAPAPSAAHESTTEPTPEPSPEPTPAPTAFSIAWMGDTQVYTAADNDVFGRMTQWVSDTSQEYNTVLTVHTGDIVYNAFREYEWQNSIAAFSRLPGGMHILTVAGNHDQMPVYDKSTPYLDHRADTDFDPAHKFDEQGFTYYSTFTAGGVNIIVFALSYGYEVDAADWINETLARYSDHYAILCLHSYLFQGGYSSVGERLVEQVVKASPNVRLVLCGHERGTEYIPEALDDDGDGTPDRTVHQMMMNVQDDPTNGVGMLRILRLDPNADTLEVITYSPVLDRFGYDLPVGGDQFGERKLLEDAGLCDFLTQHETQTR